MIDRGSKEIEVKDELGSLCSMLLSRADYEYANFCFLEVVPPFINEGIKSCIENGADSITILPYFLYPGLKLKESVKIALKFAPLKR